MMAYKDDFESAAFGELEGEKQKHEFEELSKKVIGAAIEVHRELGPGFLENIYEEAVKLNLVFRVFALSGFRDLVF